MHLISSSRSASNPARRILLAGSADYNRRFARDPRSEHDAHRPLQSSDNLARVFSWQETRLVSKSLTLNYKRVLYVLDPRPTPLELRAGEGSGSRSERTVR